MTLHTQRARREPSAPATWRLPGARGYAPASLVPTTMRHHLILAALIAGAGACATAPATQQPAPAATPVAAAQIPGGIRWFAAAAEQRAAYVQAYRLATSAIEHVAQ